MTALTFVPAPPKTGTRDGRQWLKDTEFCEGVKSALKQTYDSDSYLQTTVKGKTALRKLRGALTYFTDEQGWGLSLKTVGDETDEADEAEFTVTFRAQAKRPPVETTKPRRVRRRKGETEDDYMNRVRENYPRNKGEKEADYVARLADVILPASS